jgi:hypothetical protein
VELEFVVAGENSKPQESSRDSTSPAEFVIAIVGHENSDSSGVVKTVCVIVDVLVTVLVNVTTSVFVSKGVQEACLSRNTALRTAGAAATLLVLVLVVLGGLYESAQSVSSSSVAFSELVTVMGMQVKSLASSGSETSVTVVFTTFTLVEVAVVVSVSVAGGHAEQKPSEPQYAIDMQHWFVQQVSSCGHAPSGQQISEVGS